MNYDLERQRAIVCGGTDGIGRMIAILLSEQGVEIILIARNQKKINKTLSELSSKMNQNHNSICVDFNFPDNLKKGLLSSNLEPVDILINNSGGPHGGPLLEANEEEFYLAFNRLLICNQILAKEVVPGMKKKGHGRIINIISTSINQVIAGLGVSNTIRGSVSQWAKTLALELGSSNITVNNILPGYTETSRLNELVLEKIKNTGVTKEKVIENWTSATSLGRLGTPEEIANVALFIASSASSYITGHNFSVDGGKFKN